MSTASHSDVFKTILDTKCFYRIKLMSDAEFLSTCVLNINKFNENSSDKLNIENLPLSQPNKNIKELRGELYCSIMVHFNQYIQLLLIL